MPRSTKAGTPSSKTKRTSPIQSTEVPSLNFDNIRSSLDPYFHQIEQKIESLRTQIKESYQVIHHNALTLKDMEKQMNQHFHELQLQLKHTENDFKKIIHETQLQSKDFENQINQKINLQNQHLIKLEHSYQLQIEELMRRIQKIETIIF